METKIIYQGDPAEQMTAEEKKEYFSWIDKQGESFAKIKQSLDQDQLELLMDYLWYVSLVHTAGQDAAFRAGLNGKENET